MEVVQNHVKGVSHVTPFSKNKAVQNMCVVCLSFDNFYYFYDYVFY